MAKRLTTYEKLRRSFEAIGVILPEPDCDGIVEFEYDSWPYMMGICEDDDSFIFLEYVINPSGKLIKPIFDDALDITQDHYTEIKGHWTENNAYVCTPWYGFQGRRIVPKRVLTEMLNLIYEAHSFMMCNICLMTDESIWGNVSDINN